MRIESLDVLRIIQQEIKNNESKRVESIQPSSSNMKLNSGNKKNQKEKNKNNFKQFLEDELENMQNNSYKKK